MISDQLSAVVGQFESTIFPDRERGRIRSQCEYMRLVRTDEERYVKYFEARIGKANAAMLPRLEKWRYLLWQSGSQGAHVYIGGRPVIR